MSNQENKALRLDFTDYNQSNDRSLSERQRAFEKAVQDLEIEANGTMTYESECATTTYPNFHGNIDKVMILAREFKDICNLHIIEGVIGKASDEFNPFACMSSVTSQTEGICIAFKMK